MARSMKKRREKRRAPMHRRPAKRRVCVFCSEGVEWIDYKDADLLRRYVSERAKIRGRRVTGNCAQHQRAVSRAIKLARELALIPYVQRQVTVRGRGGRRRRDEAGPARDAMPSPATPPPTVSPPEGDEAGVEAADVSEEAATEAEDFSGEPEAGDAEDE